MLERPQPLVADLVPDRETKVLVVDDHEPFRAALEELIDAVPGFVLVGVACSGEQAVEAVDDLAPELVLMDVVMPGVGGVAAARAIVSKYPGVMIVLISVDDPALYPGATALGSDVACARKQDLCPRRLKLLWDTLHA